MVLTLVLAGCTAPAAAPTASPASTATAVSASPTVTATRGPIPTSDPARYGYIVPSAGRFVVRAERSTDAVIAIGGEQPAASPNGRRIAFWRTGPQGSNPQELRIVDVPGGAELMVTRVAAGSAGGSIVWSNDSTGLLYEVHSTQLFPGVGGGPRFSRLESFDLAATQTQGATSGELMLTNGQVFVPLGWDKAGALSTALVTGEGGMGLSYVTWDRRSQPAGQSPVKFTRFPWAVIAFTVQASIDAKRMLAIDGAANVLRIWPAGDIAAADGVVSPGGKINDARWSLGVSSELAWVLDRSLAYFITPTGSSVTLHRGQGDLQIMALRADGSGIVLNEVGRGVLVVELSTGQATMLTDFGGSIAGSVLLR